MGGREIIESMPPEIRAFLVKLKPEHISDDKIRHDVIEALVESDALADRRMLRSMLLDFDKKIFKLK